MTKIVQTKISEHSVHITIANGELGQSATEQIEILVPVTEKLEYSTVSGMETLGNVHNRTVATVQQATLRYARDLISGEIDRLAGLQAKRT